MTGRTLVATALFVFTTGPAVAQSGLDRVVGPDASGGPLEFRAFTTHELGSFSRSAHVPVGFEALPAPRNSATFRPIVLTGLSVRDAAAAMVSRDARYAWREDDGVIVFEPAEPLVPQPLDAPAPAVRLGETTAREAFGIAAALLGAPRSTPIEFSDTKPFVLDAPEGTIRSFLDAIARSHGEVVWVLERSANKDGLFPYTLLFLSGPHGWGLGLSGRPTESLDLSRFTRGATATPNVLDTIVGPRRDGSPLVIAGMWSAPRDLAAATGTPLGMQVAPGPPPTPRPAAFTATGRTLGAVLDLLAAQDSRYEWRLIDGTIVIRPSRAWGDGADPLFALVRDVQLENATMTDAVRAVASALGAAEPVLMTFPDSKTVSLAVFHGTALELLTALARAHGSLTWTFEEADEKEVETTGLTHRLTLGVAGGAGYGFLVRIGRATRRPSSR